MLWTAWPDAPLTKLSIAENITILFFILVSQIEISQLFVFKTFPEPICEFNFFIFINLSFLKNVSILHHAYFYVLIFLKFEIDCKSLNLQALDPNQS